jgi:hypothetical protein
MSQLLNLADNPLFVKHVRSRLRKGTLMPAFVIVGFLSLCIIWIDRNFANNRGRDESVGPILFFWLQSILLGLMGGSQVATSVAYVRESGILDFHRVTPVPASRQVLGFLLGAPIREWLLFAFTLPFALICSLLGPWGITNFGKLLLVQISTALFFHTLAVVIGMSGKAKGASGRLVGSLFAFNFFALMLFPQGIYPPSYFTTLAVYDEVLRSAGFPQFGVRALPPHRFFGTDLPVIVLTLGHQVALGAFLFIAASRRFRSARLPVFSKPHALTLLYLVTMLMVGDGWNWTGVGLVLTLAYVVTLTGVWLSSAVTPPLGEYYKGLQRAYKKGTPHAPIWSDLASNKVVTSGFGFILLAAAALVLIAAPLGAVQNQQFQPWAPLTVGLLTILSFAWSLQYFHLKYGKRAQVYFGMLVFFVWIAPLLVGGLLMATQLPQGGYVLAISPVVGISFSSMARVPVLATEVVQALAIGPGALMTLYYGIGMLRMEALRRQEVVAEHRPAEMTAEEA